jgi:ketosteroid isomerase-like protein
MTDSAMGDGAADTRRKVRSEIESIQRKRIDAWVKRDVDSYVSFYWPDAVLFVNGRQITVAEFHRGLGALVHAGGGCVSIDVPPLDGMIVSASADAAVVSFEWSTRFRAADGVVGDYRNQETNVWFKRAGDWKLSALHLTRLSFAPVS